MQGPWLHPVGTRPGVSSGQRKGETRGPLSSNLQGPEPCQPSGPEVGPTGVNLRPGQRFSKGTDQPYPERDTHPTGPTSSPQEADPCWVLCS